MAAAFSDEGLIPVESEVDNKSALPLAISPKPSPLTLNSSFYMQKGFCEGAKEVLRGEIGVKRVKKPVSTIRLAFGILSLG
jgi:hypothetical protein